jgi:hypothetical protein
MRTILLVFIITVSGVAKNLQITRTNNNIHKIKKGETAVQIAKKKRYHNYRIKIFQPKY